MTLSPAQARTIYSALYLALNPDGWRSPTFGEEVRQLQEVIADVYRLPWAALLGKLDLMQEASVEDAVMLMRDDLGMTDQEIADPVHVAYVDSMISAHRQRIAEMHPPAEPRVRESICRRLEELRARA